jgi:flagellar biosynthesis chaperone FliJ
MAVSHALRRLLRIRDLEEEQCRLALESAVGELHQLEHALAASHERDRRGRRLVEASVHNGQLPDRLAGLEETRTAKRFVKALTPRIVDAENDVGTLRQEFLAKRNAARQRHSSRKRKRAMPARPAGALSRGSTTGMATGCTGSWTRTGILILAMGVYSVWTRSSKVKICNE